VKLDQRVSVFFLAALAVALGTYSLVLYATLRYSLNTEFDDRLNGALQILTATVEIEPEDVTWFPVEYTLDFESKALEHARWLVADEHGRIVDQSPKLSGESPRDSIVVDYGRTPHPRHVGAVSLGGWRIAQTYVVARQPKAPELRESNEFGSLVVTVAMSHLELDAALARLAGLLAVLSMAFWGIAALLGRSYVRRSLRPLRAMVNQTESAIGAAFDLRLPTHTIQDELAELSNAFNRLLDELQRAFERERRFSSNAAHQLRTPLTILRGEIEVSLRRDRSQSEYQACLKKLAQVGTDMCQTVESLLFLARDNEQMVLPICESFDLAEWLPNYVARWNTHSRAADLDIHVEAPLRVTASGLMLMQILDNLIQNAFHYSTAGSTVLLQSTARNERIELAVHDHGIGVNPEDEGKIFDPFFRSSQSREMTVGGYGLGLAVAQRMAKLINGRLEYRRRKEVGSTFVLILPSCPSPPVDQAESPRGLLDTSG